MKGWTTALTGTIPQQNSSDPGAGAAGQALGCCGPRPAHADVRQIGHAWLSQARGEVERETHAGRATDLPEKPKDAKSARGGVRNFYSSPTWPPNKVVAWRIHFFVFFTITAEMASVAR